MFSKLYDDGDDGRILFSTEDDKLRFSLDNCSYVSFWDNDNFLEYIKYFLKIATKISKNKDNNFRKCEEFKFDDFKFDVDFSAEIYIDLFPQDKDMESNISLEVKRANGNAIRINNCAEGSDSGFDFYIDGPDDSDLYNNEFILKNDDEVYRFMLVLLRFLHFVKMNKSIEDEIIF